MVHDINVIHDRVSIGVTQTKILFANIPRNCDHIFENGVGFFFDKLGENLRQHT